MKSAQFILTADEEDRLENMVGPKGVWYDTQSFQFNFLCRQGLAPHHDVLDIGCGVLRCGLLLIDYLNEGHYHGVDVRREVIFESNKLINIFGLHAKKPQLMFTDDFGLNFCKNFDLITLFQVAYHLEDDILLKAFTAINSMLKSSGSCYLDVNTRFGSPGDKWKEFPFIRRSLEDYFTIANQAGLSTHNLGLLGSMGYTNKVNGYFNSMLQLRKNT